MAEFARRPEGEHGAAVRPRAQARRAAQGRRRRLPHARHAARGQPLSRPHRHRPRVLRLDQDQRAGQGARPRGRPRRDRAASRRSSPSAASSARRSTRRSPATSSPSPGLEKFNVADTLCSPEEVEPLHAQPIDPPTLSMTFSVNDSPLAGTEGDKVTSRVIRDRLFKEAEGNVALQRRGGAEFGRLCRLRARRIAAGDPDRDDAPRGLRARRVPAEGAVPPRRGGRNPRADRGSRDRRRRGAFRRRRAEDERAQGRDDRDAPLRRRPPAARLPRPDARPDRLSRRIAHRHARHARS